MHVPLICTVFAVSVNLQLVVGQCTGCEVSSENITETAKNESPLEDSDEPSLPLWLDIGKVDVEKIAVNVVEWVQNTWNSGVKLKLHLLKNEQNDTLVNVRFKNVDPVTENNEGEN